MMDLSVRYSVLLISVCLHSPVFDPDFRLTKNGRNWKPANAFLLLKHFD